MKKRTKRSRSKWPGLDKAVNLKIRYDAMECDYLDKLSDTEKLLLERF